MRKSMGFLRVWLGADPFANSRAGFISDWNIRYLYRMSRRRDAFSCPPSRRSVRQADMAAPQERPLHAMEAGQSLGARTGSA